MDRNFFEFWGQLFLNVAKGQQQLEDLNALLRQGLDGYESVRTMFRNMYGLDETSELFPDNVALWEKTSGNFQASLRQLMDFWGVVPKQDQQALISKCDTLEKKVEQQEQMIRHLRSLLVGKQDTAVATKDFQDLLVKQQKEFETLVNTMGFAFEEKKKPSSGKKH